MRKSSGPNSVAAKAIDVILQILSLSKSYHLASPIYFGSQSVSSGM
jgi:hypothetical protein